VNLKERNTLPQISVLQRMNRTTFSLIDLFFDFFSNSVLSIHYVPDTPLCNRNVPHLSRSSCLTKDFEILKVVILTREKKADFSALIMGVL